MCHEIIACQTHHAWLARAKSTKENDRYISRILKLLPDNISVIWNIRKRLMAVWKPNRVICKDRRILRIDWSLSAFLLLEPVLHLPETYGNQLKIKLAPRFLTLFFPCGISSENLTGKKRCKLTTSSFPMCPIKSQDIYLTPFSVHQVQGGELAHSQVRWGCFKSPLGAPQRSCRGSKWKATGVLYQACPFRDFVLMLFLQHLPLGSFSVSYSFIAVPISWNNDMNPSPCCEY